MLQICWNEKWLKPLQMGTHLRVLGESFLKNANKTWLTLLLLVANLVITKWCKKAENGWNPGIWVLIWGYSVRIHPMNTNTTRFRWFKTFASLYFWRKHWTKVISASEGLKVFYIGGISETWFMRKYDIIIKSFMPSPWQTLSNEWIDYT